MKPLLTPLIGDAPTVTVIGLCKNAGKTTTLCRILEELGQIRKVTTHDGNERYDAICEDHAHFICRSCGAIRDLPGIDPDRIRDGLGLEDGYRISNLDMLLRGTCPVCNSTVLN